MASKNIDKDSWKDFFDSFSQEYEGRETDIEVYDDGSAKKFAVAKNLPFNGISMDTNVNSISVMAGDRPDDHITHIISSPEKVNLEETEMDHLTALRVESEDGSNTLIRFK